MQHPRPCAEKESEGLRAAHLAAAVGLHGVHARVGGADDGVEGVAVGGCGGYAHAGAHPEVESAHDRKDGLLLASAARTFHWLKASSRPYRA